MPHNHPGEYDDLETAGPDGSHPSGYKPGQLKRARIQHARSLAHQLGPDAEAKLRKSIGNKLKSAGRFQTLANALLHGKNK